MKKLLTAFLITFLAACGSTGSDGTEDPIARIGAWELNTSEKHADYIGVQSQSKMSMSAVGDTIIITQPGERQLSIDDDSTGNSDFIISFIDSTLTLEHTNVDHSIDVTITGVNEDLMSVRSGASRISSERSSWKIIGSHSCQIAPQETKAIIKYRFINEATNSLVRQYNVEADSLVSVIENINCDTPI